MSYEHRCLPRDVPDRDRHSAALHEAAHAVLTHRFGGAARAYIWPNSSGGKFEEKSWTGTCELWALPGSFAPATVGAEVIEPPVGALALIGLAGVAAEIYEQMEKEEAVFFELQSFLEVEELSASDQALVGDDVSAELIEQVIMHIGKCWAGIERLAAELERFPEPVRPEHLD